MRKFNSIVHGVVSQENALTVTGNDFTIHNNQIDNNQWLVNLSNVVIPDKVSNILKLGEKFCPPVSDKMVPYVQIIADVESALISNDNVLIDKPRLRNEFVNILTNFKNRSKESQFLTTSERGFIKDVSLARKFVKDHSEILVTRADKGNITVVVDRCDYVNKIQSMLEDTNTYQMISKDNTASIQRNLNHMVSLWHNEGRITDYEAKSLKSHHGVVAKLYGLPKIHKENAPYRPIVSSIGTPLYHLSAFLSRILNSTVGKSSTHVLNSGDFKEKIKNTCVPADHTILSLDVVSLFTNIDSKLALKLLDSNWKKSRRTPKQN